MTESVVRVSTGMDIAWADRGSAADPTLLMVHGFGAQLTSWNPGLLDELAGRGLHVVVFDNRDVGLSTHLDAFGPVDPLSLIGGATVQPPYLLNDMAADAVGLLDVLGLDSVHVLGVSLGGMIAQTMAIEHAERLRSLTSVMSTPHHSVGPATPAAIAALLSPPAADVDGAVARALRVASVIGSQVHERDEDWIGESARINWDRAQDPAGVSRQFAALRLSPDRRPGLADVGTPTLVLHGEADHLIGVDGGLATAKAVPGSTLLTLPGMGHDIPRALWSTVVDAVVAHVEKAEAARAESGAPRTDQHARWGRLADPEA